MNLDFSPEENAFRQEVRAFIAENYPPELRAAQDSGAPDRELYLAWHKVLAKKGWVRAVVAGGVRRDQLDADAEVHLVRGIRRGRDPAPAAVRREHGWRR